jgi:hypothetical protein
MGAEAAEMDVRLSAQGHDAIYYPNGEVFLTHDWDLRGETLPDPNQPINVIYALPPSQLRNRNMVDRRGNASVGSDGKALQFHSFTDILQSQLSRVKLIPGGLVAGAGLNGNALVSRGMLLVIDIKGDPPKLNPAPPVDQDQYSTLLECLKEMHAFEKANKVDMSLAVAFKINYKKMPLLSQFMSDLRGNPSPNLIFIVFPEDVVTPIGPSGKCDDPGQPACTALSPGDPLLQNLDNFIYTYPNFLVVDWQYRNPGNALGPFIDRALAAGQGVAMFAAFNNFPEGVRNSSGTCSQKPGGANLSECVSGPLQTWASCSFDYLVPYTYPRARVRASSITTDAYEGAVSYLRNIGQRDNTL